jgi:hypothetical protein
MPFYHSFNFDLYFFWLKDFYLSFMNYLHLSVRIIKSFLCVLFKIIEFPSYRYYKFSIWALDILVTNWTVPCTFFWQWEEFIVLWSFLMLTHMQHHCHIEGLGVLFHSSKFALFCVCLSRNSNRLWSWSYWYYFILVWFPKSKYIEANFCIVVPVSVLEDDPSPCLSQLQLLCWSGRIGVSSKNDSPYPSNLSLEGRQA